jgi:hypothetical protein
MPKVYNTNFNPRHSYEKAETLGQVIHMTKGYIPSDKIYQFQNDFKSYAKQAAPGDFLLLSGSNLVCVLAVAAWLEVHGEVIVLQHTKSRGIGEEAPTDFYLSYNVSTKSNERSSSG